MTNRDSQPVAITAIIPALNHEIQAAQSLRSIAAQNRPAAETVVADRGSSDATIAVARENHADVLRVDGVGIAEATDAAIAAAKQPWVAVVECGAVWHSSLLNRVEPLLEDGSHAELIVCAYGTVGATPLNARRRTVHDGPRSPTVFLKRALWESAGSLERARVLASSRKSILVIDDPFVHVRETEGRIRRRLRIWRANSPVGRARSRLAFPVAIPPRSPANHCFQPSACEILKETFTRQTAAAKRVALTFDDGPNPSTTPQILHILQRMNVRGTFFLLGRRLRREPALGRRLAAAGMELANHTMTHPQLTLFETAAQVREIREASAVIEELCGISCRYFRPPYGLFDHSTLEAASQSDQTTVLWNVDSEDWSGIEAPEIVRRCAAGKECSAVVLLHDGLQSTVEALPAIIQRYRQAGFVFGTVSELLSETTFAR
jgi:peptidoglycan/xylan/chitin deacetylase (PgdA/CDA1 family)